MSDGMILKNKTSSNNERKKERKNNLLTYFHHHNKHNMAFKIKKCHNFFDSFSFFPFLFFWNNNTQ